MFESKGGILWVGGLGFFVFAFLSNGLVPMVMYKDLPEQPLVAAQEDGTKTYPLVNSRLMYQFGDLRRRYPEQFEKYYGPEATEEKCADALRLGRQVYIGEGCWHCHSQFVRPVSNESLRWGPVATTEEYQNELQRPVMFGTRRVGPDLSREGGRRSNDWHAVHFFRPRDVSVGSPMPDYPWFFDGSPDKPNQRGIAIVTYVQWLGSWLDSYPYYEELAEITAEEGR
jgi:hypothetical protein